MSSETVHISDRAAALRASFDRTFAEAQHFNAVVTDDFLGIHVSGEPYALRLDEISGFFADRKVTRMPSRVANLTGVASSRGAMFPVYDLAAMLGYPQSKEARWIAVATDARIALAFDAFDGHFRCPRHAIATSEAAGREHIRGIARSEDRTCPIIDLASIVATVKERAQVATSRKEQ